MAQRILLDALLLANRIYAGATVTIWQADASGQRTSVKATIYSATTGTDAVANPQILDGDGKLQQPVYHDVAVIITVDGLMVGSHETGVIRAPATDADIATATALGRQTIFEAQAASDDASSAADSATAAAASAAAALLSRTQALALADEKVTEELARALLIANNLSDVADLATTLVNLGVYFGQTPGGRLTLTTAVPVLTADVAAAATVYYTPIGKIFPIWNGTRWTVISFSETSQTTADATKSPAEVANNSNYDYFGWMDGTTFRVTRGPAWTSDTARGTGAGTTELDFTQGLPRNKVAITNGPGAGLGTYVGTVRSNGTATIDMKFGTLATGGGESRICVWNCYNRVDVAAMVRDDTNTWTLAASSIRSANNSATMRCTFVRGLNEDAIEALYSAASTTSASGLIGVGVGLDSTAAFSGWTGVNYDVSQSMSNIGGYYGAPGLGLHYVQALEASQAGGTQTFYGDGGTTYNQNGLAVRLKA